MNSSRDRRSLRLPEYNYSQAGAYFITICTHKKRILLAHIIEDKIKLSAAGLVVQSIWESLHMHFPTVQTDAFVVMPNHIHGIILIVNDDVGAIHAVSHRRAAGVAARTVNCPYTIPEFNDEGCYYRW